jgi:hypothetical protein
MAYNLADLDKNGFLDEIDQTPTFGVGAAYYGGATTYVLDVDKYERPKLVEELMPKLSECSIVASGQTCIGESASAVVYKTLGVNNMEEAKVATGCETEKCAVQTALKRAGVHRQKIEGILAIHYKPDGPTGTELLSNINIDAIMRQYGARWPEFFPYNFNMRDYASFSFVDGEVIHRPDTLATITYEDLAEKYKCCGCVINSDVYSGAGKHWMALFADWRGKPTVEFFNSSGNAPAPEFVNWMVKMKMASGGELINVNVYRHQHTKTECGVYALFYIYARLNGKSWEDFTREPIPDQAMFEFRQHLFSQGKEFDYSSFKAGAKIEWEDDHNSM